MELPSENDFYSFQQAHRDALPALYSQITDTANINAVIQGVPGAAQNDTARKNRVQQLITEIRNYSTQLDQTIGSIQREHASISQFVKGAKGQTESLRDELKEKDELAELRREQASDLKYKFDADYHSSVLGLWRPLHPNTRGILYTVSIVLAILAIISIGYLIVTQYGSQIFTSPAKSLFSMFSKGAGTSAATAAPSAPTGLASLFNTENDNGRVIGGFMKFRPKK